MTAEQMQEVITKHNIKSPITLNDLSEPMQFNLMFSTNIGPTGTLKGLVRAKSFDERRI